MLKIKANQPYVFLKKANVQTNTLTETHPKTEKDVKKWCTVQNIISVLFKTLLQIRTGGSKKLLVPR